MKVKLTKLAVELERSLGIPFLPKRQSPEDAGLDLRACISEPLVIASGETVKVPTGVHIWLGSGLAKESSGTATYAAMYLPRSSSPGLVLTNTVGVLDCQYQGESFCKWRNMTDKPITIEPAERMAQLVVIIVPILPIEVVDKFEEDTGRGKGFGSSGRI